MTNEIETQKMPVMMKDGLVHWVGPETHARIQQALVDQRGHNFIKLIELGITINTAEISAVYTLEQYQDLEKAKQGMWQCSYKKWHEKRGVCECKRNFYEEQKAAREAIEDARLNRKPTEEERMRSAEAMDAVRIDLERRGVLPRKLT